MVGQAEDTPTWPDVFDGTDSVETVTSDGIKVAVCRQVVAIATDATSNRTYWFGPVSVAAMFQGSIPKRFVAFVTHDTGVNLHATAANHAIYITPVYETI